MSKKMMKRTAALSALIAVALSGTVFAKDITTVDTVQPATGLSATAEDTVLNVGGADLSAYPGTKAPTWIRPAYEGTTTVSGWDTITFNGSNFAPANSNWFEIAFYTNGENAKMTLSDIGTIKTNIAEGQHDKVAFFYSQSGTIDITADSIQIENVGSAVQVNTDGVGDGSVVINANDVTLSGGRGVNVYSNATNAASGTASVDINATGTLDIVGSSYGVLAQGDGDNIINIDGNEVSIEGTDAAVYVYNGSQVNVGQESGSVDITGSVMAYGAGEKSVINVELGEEGSMTGDVINYGGSEVSMDLGTDSTMTGNVWAMGGETSVDVGAGSTLNGIVSTSGGGTSDLSLDEGATWTSYYDSSITTLTNDGGNIIMASETGQTITVDTLAGDGGTVTTNSLESKLVVGDNQAQNTTVKATEELTNALEESDMDIETAIETFANSVDGGESVTTVELAEGSLLGETSATIGANGITNIITKENKANAGLIDMTALSVMTWRGENDDLNERLGDLRNAKQERGIWTRMSRAQQSYNTVTNQYNMYQIGYDQQAGDWTLGAAYSYTDGKSWFNQGTGENTHNVFSLYGTKMNKNGSFIDVVAKYGNLDYDYELAGGVGGGAYDTDAYSFSVETGKRITSSNGAWVEPQVQLTYGMVDDVAFTTKNGFNVRQDSVDSFVARAGIMAGKPICKGNIYLKASYLYDFAGEVEGTFANEAGRSVDISRDLGGGWWEVGAGLNYNLSDATYLYLDFEKAFGGEVDIDWKWNAGVRYSF